MAPNIVLVCGMHRSGTSLMVNLLKDLGLETGDILDQAKPDNPDGYGEHRAVVQAQEALLDTFCRTWHGPDGAEPLPSTWMDWPQTETLRALIRQLAMEHTQNGQCWVVKDPRTSRLLRLWLDTLVPLGYRVQVLHCLRSPSAVAGSLFKRNQMPDAQARQAWLIHHHDILNALALHPTVAHHRVAYDAWHTDPETTLDQVLTALHINPAGVDRTRVLGRIQTHYRHHHDEPDPSPSGQFYQHLLTGTESRREPSFDPTQRVLVVVRTKDRPLFLPRMIHSILAQTHPYWHAVVVNDGGDPGPVEAVLAPYQAACAGRLTLAHRPHAGMEASSNWAITEHPEPFIAIHDDDDTWRPGFLRKCLQRLHTTQAYAVRTQSIVVRERVENGRIEFLSDAIFDPENKPPTWPALLRCNQFPPISMVMRRTLIDHIGLYDPTLPVLGDWDFNLRAVEFAPIETIDTPLARWHRRPKTDPMPNSAMADHRRWDALVRDRILRRHPMMSGLIAASYVLPDDAPIAPKPVEPITAPVACMPTTDWDWTLLPALAHGLTGQLGGAMVAEHDDPQWLYQLPQPLPPGQYDIDLKATPCNGVVELFYAHDGHYHHTRRIVLRPAGPGHYLGRVQSHAVITHLRVDPQQCTGPVHGGSLRIRAHRPTGRLPTLLGIGAQRAGTTWLHTCLAQHPDVYAPHCKELHALDAMAGIDSDRWTKRRLGVLQAAIHACAGKPATDPCWTHLAWAGRYATPQTLDWDWYSSLFAQASQRVRLDITPAYGVLPAQMLAEATRMMPDVRAVLMLRNPVERALSGAMHACTLANNSVEPPSQAALEAALWDPRCQARSDYRTIIEGWEAVLQPGHLYIDWFDRLQTDAAGVAKGLTDWLGLAPHPHTVGIENALPVVAHWDPAIIKRLIEAQEPTLVWLRDRFGGIATRWLDDATRARDLR